MKINFMFFISKCSTGRIIFYSIFFFILGCQERVEYLPGFKFLDEKRCYIENEEFSTPLLVYLVRGYDLEITDNVLFLGEIEAALVRGCEVDEPDSEGLSPLNTAILFSQLDVAKKLLAYGADPKKKIKSYKKIVNDKNSFELSEWLLENDFSESRRTMNEFMKNFK